MFDNCLTIIFFHQYFLLPLFLPTFILIISSSNAIHNPKKDQYPINILNSPLLFLIFPHIQLYIHNHYYQYYLLLIFFDSMYMNNVYIYVIFPRCHHFMTNKHFESKSSPQNPIRIHIFQFSMIFIEFISIGMKFQLIYLLYE